MNILPEIQIGVLHSLSGTMAISEAHLVDAVLMAIEEVNRGGGVLGRPVRPIVEDGASEPDTFAAKAEKLLAEEQVATIFGCWTSSSRKAVKPVVERHHSLLWYPVQYEGLEESPNIIYTGSCLNQQIEPAVHWALARGQRRCFLLGSDYVFPRIANRLIHALVTRGDGHVLDERYVPLGSRDFAEAVVAIQRLQPDIVFNTINGEDNLAFFREYTRRGMDADACPVMSFSFSEI
jgi:ABC-type branched-subunit amino acid transport system substrate-binding protein